MTAAIFLVYAFIHVALFVTSIALLYRRRTLSTVPLSLVTAGLAYDNAMIAVGGSLGVGQELMQLSVPRFFMHALATPMLLLAALGLIQRTSADWSHAQLAKVFSLTLVVLLIAVGFWSDMLMLELEPKSEGSILSYSNANSFPVAPIATIIALIAAGLVLWRNGGGTWVLLGTLTQLAVTFVGEAVVFAGNFGEVALLAALVWTDVTVRPKVPSLAEKSVGS